ncbi:MAG TPA: DUF2892 domain-containing protein, partial [Thermoanaerobaculia bacterium]
SPSDSGDPPEQQSRRHPMTVDRYLRLIAGLFIFLSVALGWYVHPAFFFFTAFVGLNLVQSAFTDWCPMMALLRRLGVRDTAEPAIDAR